MALNEFMDWFQQGAARPGFTKAAVSGWPVSLEEHRLGFVVHRY
jgi:hypothetical protein